MSLAADIRSLFEAKGPTGATLGRWVTIRGNRVFIRDRVTVVVPGLGRMGREDLVERMKNPERFEAELQGIVAGLKSQREAAEAEADEAIGNVSRYDQSPQYRANLALLEKIPDDISPFINIGVTHNIFNGRPVGLLGEYPKNSKELADIFRRAGDDSLGMNERFTELRRVLSDSAASTLVSQPTSWFRQRADRVETYSDEYDKNLAVLRKIRDDYKVATDKQSEALDRASALYMKEDAIRSGIKYLRHDNPNDDLLGMILDQTASPGSQYKTERRGDHWGRALSDNKAAQGMAFAQGNKFRPLDKGMTQVDLSIDLDAAIAGVQRANYAQRRMSESSREEWPVVMRGSRLPPHVLDKLVTGETTSVQLTGATAFTFDEGIARHYATSEWTRENSKATSKPVLIRMKRSDKFDQSVGMFHEKVEFEGKTVVGPAFEIVTGASRMRVTRAVREGDLTVIDVEVP